MVRERKTEAFGVSVVGVVEVEVEIAKKDEFPRTEAVVIEKRVEFLVKHGGCEFVFGTGRGSVYAVEDDTLTGFVEENFSRFKRRRRERKMVRERQTGVKNIFIQNGNTAAPAGTGKGLEFVTWGCQLSANGLVT